MYMWVHLLVGESRLENGLGLPGSSPSPLGSKELFNPSLGEEELYSGSEDYHTPGPLRRKLHSK